MAYNSKYRKNIVRLIIQGKTNKEIYGLINCNAKLPQVTRRWWTRLTEEEQRAWLIDNDVLAMADQDLEEQPEPEEETTGFNTPAKIAKGRFVISRY